MGAARSGRRVLLAEDDAPMRRLLALALSADGFEVIEAATGGELMDRVVDLVFNRPPDGKGVDLIISDVRMPVVSGLHVVTRLRQLDKVTPVILITAFGDEETHGEAERLGARVFDKPFDLDDLRLAARHLT